MKKREQIYTFLIDFIKEKGYQPTVREIDHAVNLKSSSSFVSIITGSTPLATKEWGLSNKMTSKALGAIGEIGGPRCCKRDSFTAIREAVLFAKENLNVEMETEEIICTFSELNNQCIKERCPYYKTTI